MHQYFSADFVLPITSPPMPEAVIETTLEGQVVRIWEDRSMLPSDVSINTYKGMIAPGFINAHCHLELSHMRGIIPRETGLVRFIQSVITNRHADESDIIAAMVKADLTMQANGIVAVGDHANTSISCQVKEQSPIYYHTFLEVMGFAEDQADSIWQKAKSTMEDFGRLTVTPTPHAPYSTSKSLLRLIKKSTLEEVPIVSFHNQESAEENKLFIYRAGDFIEFYKWLDQDISHFKPGSRSSIQTIGNLFPKDRPIQLVHNTFSSIRDSAFLTRINLDVYWCICPSANQYIEGKIPNIKLLNQSGKPVTIGTDSLASNEKLCILSEMKSYHKQYPDATFSEMLQWATWNGAQVLGITDQFGSIEVGKKPGINLIQNISNFKINTRTTVKKLI